VNAQRSTSNVQRPIEKKKTGVRRRKSAKSVKTEKGFAESRCARLFMLDTRLRGYDKSVGRCGSECGSAKVRKCVSARRTFKVLSSK